MADTRRTITAAGRKKYEEELFTREHDTRDEINERLQVAREFGDLSENAEYDAAREEQAANEKRINELKQILATAKVVDVSNINTRDLTAAVGTEVMIENAQGKRLTFSLVGTNETNSLQNQISNESPVGEALIGHRMGDEISFMMPSGKMASYRIVSIKVAERAE
jgi:transcription elongation factor GreA